MEYKDYMEILPDNIISALREGYSDKRVQIFSNKNEDDSSVQDKALQIKFGTLYKLLSKSSAYFNSYKNLKVVASGCCDVNLKHKDIIKTLSCCNDFSIYEGYLVPRYLNMGRCYTDHYCTEMDILKLLLILLMFNNIGNKNTICQMAMDRIEVINSLVLQKNSN